MMYCCIVEDENRFILYICLLGCEEQKYSDNFYGSQYFGLDFYLEDLELYFFETLYWVLEF